MTARLAIVGAGMMGEALTRGLLGAGWGPDDIVVCDVRSERVEQLRDELGVQGASTPPDAANAARGVLLAVKPQDAGATMADLAGHVGVDGLVSIVAGLRTSAMESALGETSVVRAMPNTPARVACGVTALARGSRTDGATATLADDIFGGVGPVVWVEEEALDAVTAISGSGPAYVFLLAEMMMSAAAAMGLPDDVARTLTAHTVEGAGRMLTQLPDDPATLRTQVTSAGGTTEAALAVLEARDVRAIFTAALMAARDRSVELGS